MKTAKLVADPVLAAHVTERLEAKDSPMTISIELARGGHGMSAAISHECIYQAVYAHGRRGLRRGLRAGLHRRRRCRKHRRVPAMPAPAGSLGEFNLIGRRTEIAEQRTEVGHLDGDLIVGAFNRHAIATVFDRASRHLWLADFPEDHGADATLAALVEILERIPTALRRTLTWDQGREMARHATWAEWCGIDVYFAEPHSPWQHPPKRTATDSSAATSARAPTAPPAPPTTCAPWNTASTPCPAAASTGQQPTTSTLPLSR